jgi:Protein of unknown function (DUF2750)
MTYELSDEEKAGVLATSDDKRYGYLVNKAADWGEVFALKMGDNWASLTTDDQKYFPIWPHPGFAEGVLTGDWKDAVAEPIEVHDFLDVLARLEELGDEVALVLHTGSRLHHRAARAARERPARRAGRDRVAGLQHQAQHDQHDADHGEDDRQHAGGCSRTRAWTSAAPPRSGSRS